MRHGSLHTGTDIKHFEVRVRVLFVLFDHLFSLVDTYCFGRHCFNFDQENNTISNDILVLI